MPLKVAVIGARGRMGSEVCRAVDQDPDLQLVAQIVKDDELQALVDAGTDVAVEFTTPDAVKDNVRFCLDHDIHTVVGATGLDEDDIAELEEVALGSAGNLFIAPNFAIGAVLMMRFAAAAARYFDSAEIIERHHENKVDAPSGTALRTARLMNASRTDAWTAPAGDNETLSGSRGGDVDGIRVHSLRVRGSVAHQDVVLGSPGETLTIRHDSLDRSSFMPGVLLAVKKVPELGPLTVGLENLLDLGS